jgi:hypothetical protein
LKTITPQLPTVFGSFAAMLVAFLSLMSGTSPSTCLMKAAAAFMVFAGIGLILRYVLMETVDDHTQHGNAERRTNPSGGQNGLDVIVPGTSVADLLGAVESDEEAT